MFKLLFSIIFFHIAGCVSSQIEKTAEIDAHYFSDATDCFRSTQLIQKQNIPVGSQITPIEIPLGSDAGAFRLCMKYKGHPFNSASAEADSYLNVSKNCLQEAQSSSTPDATYAACVKRGTIKVEFIPSSSPK
ncbi:MAG: hypothetical protein IPN42_06385 [Methylococcaceae bacterium]|nr:hypothetical protein [Methylococcaceae bacterium]